MIDSDLSWVHHFLNFLLIIRLGGQGLPVPWSIMCPPLLSSLQALNPKKWPGWRDIKMEKATSWLSQLLNLKTCP